MSICVYHFPLEIITALQHQHCSEDEQGRKIHFHRNISHITLNRIFVLFFHFCQVFSELRNVVRNSEHEVMYMKCTVAKII